MKQYITNICFGLDINILVDIFGKENGENSKWGSKENLSEMKFLTLEDV